MPGCSAGCRVRALPGVIERTTLGADQFRWRMGGLRGDTGYEASMGGERTRPIGRCSVGNSGPARERRRQYRGWVVSGSPGGALTRTNALHRGTHSKQNPRRTPIGTHIGTLAGKHHHSNTHPLPVSALIGADAVQSGLISLRCRDGSESTSCRSSESSRRT